MTQFDKVQFDRLLRRPTCCLTNFRLGLQGLKDSRAFVSSESAEPDQSVWPHGFRITVADAIHEWNAAAVGIGLRKVMTKSELAEWKAHIECDHWPYRRDCSVCLSASGTGRPARRVAHRDAYVKSLDIAGPFAEVVGMKSGDAGTALRWPRPTSTRRFVRCLKRHRCRMRRKRKSSLRRRMTSLKMGNKGQRTPVPGFKKKSGERRSRTSRSPWRCKLFGFVYLWSATVVRKEILEAVQDLYVKIRATGLPLTRIHSDRAREFRVKPLRKWCRERDIFQTYTEGLAPTQKATAESHVRRSSKSKARLHLQSGELEKELWPCAMKHPEIKFGAVVWVKSKKDCGPFDPRWERGVYLGPADDVREGHVVRLDDGSWLRTLHMRTVRDDEVEDDDEEEYVVDLMEPTRRVRGKNKLADPELRVADARSRKTLVDKLLASSIWEALKLESRDPR